MARIYFAGAESGDLSECGGSSLNGAVATDQVTNGAYSYKFASGVAGYRESATGFNKTTAFLKFWIRISAAPSGQQDIGGFANSTDQTQVKLSLKTDQTVLVENVTTGSFVTVGTSTATIPTATWTLVECKFVVSAGSGIIELRIAGNVEVSGTSLTTNGRGNADRVYWGPASGNVGIDEWYDDIVVDDAAYPGGSYVIARSPVTGGTPIVDNWPGKSSGTDAGALWNDTPFNTATFVNSGSTTNVLSQTAVIESFFITQTGHGTGVITTADTVNGAKTAAIAKTSNTGSGGASGSIIHRVNATNTFTAKTLTTSDKYFEDYWFPSASDLNAGDIEAGWRKETSTANRTQTVEDVWTMIDYTPAADTTIGGFNQYYSRFIGRLGGEGASV